MKRLLFWLRWSFYYRMGAREGWENGACAAFRKLKEDGLITPEQYVKYLEDWYL